MPSQSSVGGKLIGRVLIPKVKVLLKSICDQIIFVNEFGHHFKHYGQFNIACFPNSEVQRFVISEELAEMATKFGINLNILLEEQSGPA
jgi:hypothetical protein